MNESKHIELDFKKWILFNKRLSDFQHLYDLHCAVNSQKNSGSVSFREEETDGQISYVVEQEGVSSILRLIGFPARKQFLDYLLENYFPSSDVEGWYRSKTMDREKLQNHQTLRDRSNPYMKTKVSDFMVHPSENMFFKIRLFFSTVFYLIILGILANILIDKHFFSAFLFIGVIGAIVVIIALSRWVLRGFLIGFIKGNSVKLNESQYAEIYQLVQSQAKELGLNYSPETYIIHGFFNAFVTKLARKKYLVLHSEVVETAMKGDYEVARFIIGHELGHLKRKHLTTDKWLLPSNFIPFLYHAHSRSCEYTCDRIGYHFSSQGAMEGVLILATGKEIYSKIQINKLLEYAEYNSFWVWFSELFMTHPHTTKRLKAIKDYDLRLM